MVMVVIAGLAVIGVALPHVTAGPDAGALAAAGASPKPSPSPTPAPATASASPPAPVLRLAGPVPAAGTGDFTFGATRGEVAGRFGTLKRYRVGVEVGSEEDAAEFGAVVDEVLADPRSWIGGNQLRLQRVPDGAGHDFTVYLATAETTRKMCQAGWVDIRIDGQSYTSCRAPGKIIINLDRWRLSVNHYADDGVPLAVYRAYVINHEVGHELGNRHQRCPGEGEPAPVMMQQTLFLNGCVANPWPYLSGQRYTGPLL